MTKKTFSNEGKKQASIIVLVILICIGIVIISALTYVLYQIVQPPDELLPIPEAEGIEKFASKQEFKDYLASAPETSTGYTGFGGMGLGVRAMPQLAMPEGMSVDAPLAAPMETGEAIGGFGAPERVSETTVQVPGIDEPDIVKTDGKEIYFSPQISFIRPMPIIMEESVEKEAIFPPPQRVRQTKLVKAFPPTELFLDSSIDKAGNLLLKNNILVIFSGQEILGYDVTDPQSPEKKWKVELEERTSLVSARLYENKIYVVTKQNINYSDPCPIIPLSVRGRPIEIGCTHIYHPRQPISVDTNYSAIVLDSNDGSVLNKTSFVGSSGNSIVYMSQQGLYVTYPYYVSMTTFMLDFFQEEFKDFLPSSMIEKLQKIKDYDISEISKLTEISIILQKYFGSLTTDEEMKMENELTNRMQDYNQKYQRELQRTGIMKIGLDNFTVLATGNVPGTLLNQFSLDEYLGYLRVATTVGERWGIFSSGESVNDVYVLDNNLNIVGQVLDLGKTERIYSVRFIQDKGYVVTFKRIDPFYVIDLSDPRNPVMKGELKIPGYSSYLHPITKDDILGIGKEGSQVKVSLFDVSSPENPVEKDTYVLKEYWSDILNTHHAFLLDDKHKIFFLPGSQGAYIFSYQNDTLALEKTLSARSVRRAIYINDYLYIIGDQQIWVLDENTWEQVSKLEFQE
ncbi:beta-propeller domain-containing protein [Patescibacteria group bacterium AH-259-L05]|nr:beta-propeller domain-containing protein [Patescibacteria group bacterium AH-259-L05]